jgi:hypothetical protein
MKTLATYVGQAKYETRTERYAYRGDNTNIRQALLEELG